MQRRVVGISKTGDIHVVDLSHDYAGAQERAINAGYRLPTTRDIAYAIRNDPFFFGRINAETLMISEVKRANEGRLRSILHDAKSRIGFGTAFLGIATGVVIENALIPASNTMYMAYVIYAGGAAFIADGIAKLRKVNRLRRDIQEKLPEEVFRNMKRYL